MEHRKERCRSAPDETISQSRPRRPVAACGGDVANPHGYKRKCANHPTASIGHDPSLSCHPPTVPQLCPDLTRRIGAHARILPKDIACRKPLTLANRVSWRSFLTSLRAHPYQPGHFLAPGSRRPDSTIEPKCVRALLHDQTHLVTHTTRQRHIRVPFSRERESGPIMITHPLSSTPTGRS